MTREQTCHLRDFTTVWEIGTGLRVSLPPGKYQVTGADSVDGVDYLYLNNLYRADRQRMRLIEVPSSAGPKAG